MVKRPKLDNLNYLFDANDEFSLTEAQYESKTEARLPKNSKYLLQKSALANKCRELGFDLKLQEKVVFFRKIGE